MEKQRVVRPNSLRAIEQADADEQLLKDLVRKLALYKASLGSEADAERLIAASQAEIERTRRQSRIDLEEIVREVEEDTARAADGYGSVPSLRRVSLIGCSLNWAFNSRPMIGSSGMRKVISQAVSSSS